MQIDILTLFPEMFPGYFNASILQRAQAAGRLAIRLHNIRDYAAGKHRVTDEPPFGGGGGMVLKPEPIFAAVEAILSKQKAENHPVTSSPRHPVTSSPRHPVTSSPRHPVTSSPRHPVTLSPCHPVILLSPQGRPFTQQIAQELAGHERLLLICGRYEGVDERVRQHLATDEISIGDYVLTGGELPAMVLVDAVARLLPGALGAEGAAERDSHATGLLEGPHYTRPATFRGWETPATLRSGHAANIQRWRRQQALRRTWQRRPDLLSTAVLTEEDKRFLRLLAEETVNREEE